MIHWSSHCEFNQKNMDRKGQRTNLFETKFIKTKTTLMMMMMAGEERTTIQIRSDHERAPRYKSGM